MAKVGVLICHCGTNIAAAVDVEALAQKAYGIPGVIFSATHKYACSLKGQELIKEAIREHNLDRLVIAACTPRQHEATFRRLLEQTDLNPYMLEIANIREQCAWVHKNTARATEKALDLLSMAVAKVVQSRPLFADKLPLTKKCLVLGGGIGGMQAALDIAEAGYQVTLVEREPSLGGKMMMLDKTFPTLDCAACVATPKVAEVSRHPRIKVLTSAELESVSGFIGNFQVTVTQKPSGRLHEDTFGGIIVATGYELLDWGRFYPEYGGGRYANVLDGLELENLLNASGPTEGRIICPGSGREPKTVVIVQCVGSRDPARGKAYCSRACCMYGAKHSRQILEKIPDAAVYVFYVDMRAPGKGYEEFYNQARRDGAIYIRGRMAKIYEENGQLICWGEDTLSGSQVTVHADMVVLETAMIPAPGTAKIASLLALSLDEYGWLNEAHPKLRPVEAPTGGVFICGAAQGPKDITDTVAQASAAAAKVLIMFAKDELIANPQVAVVDSDRCGGCGLCLKVCPTGAISMRDMENNRGVSRSVAQVNTVLCSGCGVCAAACRGGCLDVAGFSNKQLLEEVDALWHT